MRDGDEAAAPRVPIPGAAGNAVAAALQKMTTHFGEMRLIIDKERVAGGGYVYTLSFTQPPARPVPKQR